MRECLTRQQNIKDSQLVSFDRRMDGAVRPGLVLFSILGS
jgi:hypothetical protein